MSDAPDASAALSRVLEEAQERDEVTLWHLLTRVNGADRDRVFDRLAQFVPPPSTVTRDGIRAGRRDMLDAWWDALGLGTAGLVAHLEALTGRKNDGVHTIWSSGHLVIWSSSYRPIIGGQSMTPR